MKTFLITHTCRNGRNTACKEISAGNGNSAVKKFETLYPQRNVSNVTEKEK